MVGVGAKSINIKSTFRVVFFEGVHVGGNSGSIQDELEIVGIIIFHVHKVVESFILAQGEHHIVDFLDVSPASPLGFGCVGHTLFIVIVGGLVELSDVLVQFGGKDRLVVPFSGFLVGVGNVDGAHLNGLKKGIKMEVRSFFGRFVEEVGSHFGVAVINTCSGYKGGSGNIKGNSSTKGMPFVVLGTADGSSRVVLVVVATVANNSRFNGTFKLAWDGVRDAFPFAVHHSGEDGSRQGGGMFFREQRSLGHKEGGILAGSSVRKVDGRNGNFTGNNCSGSRVNKGVGQNVPFGNGSGTRSRSGARFKCGPEFSVVSFGHGSLYIDSLGISVAKFVQAGDEILHELDIGEALFQIAGGRHSVGGTGVDKIEAEAGQVVNIVVQGLYFDEVVSSAPQGFVGFNAKRGGKEGVGSGNNKARGEMSPFVSDSSHAGHVRHP
jgi:hypothetical protein